MKPPIAEKAEALRRDALRLVADRFPADSLVRFHVPDLVVRIRDHESREFEITLVLWTTEPGGKNKQRSVLFRVAKPTANSCLVAFKKKLMEVEP